MEPRSSNPRASTPGSTPPFDRSSLSRILGEGEDPLSWSLPLGSLFGIRIRAHFLLAIWVAVELFGPIHPGALGPLYAGCLIASFVLIVLVRELCRSAFARGMGRQLDTVVLWPLGGISHTVPLSRVHAGLQPAITESGGLLFGMLAWPVLAAAVWMLGGRWAQVSFNPLNPAMTLAGIGNDLHSIASNTGANPFVLIGAWSLYYANAIVLLANLLLPMFPLDGARIVLAWQERRLGDLAAAAFVAKVGFLTALVTLVLGSALESTRVMALAVIGGLVTWFEFRRAVFLERPLQPELAALDDPPSVGELPVSPEAIQEADEAADSDEARLDALLGKISRQGMSSLSEEDQTFLRAMTRRRQRE